MGEKSLRLRKVLFEGFSLVSLVVLVLLIVFTALGTGASPIFVMLGFMPTIATIILCLVIFDETVFSFIILWLVPIVLSGIFYLIASSQPILNNNLDIGALVALNLVFSILYLVIFFIIAKFAGRSSQELQEKKQENKPSHTIIQHQPTKIKEYVASIEDKSKALNFVIGRVYSKFHGGSKQLREKLALKPEWYNEFSEALNNEANPDRRRLLSVLDNIEKQLALMNLTEREILHPEQISELKNLDRDDDGNSTIIEVLIKNDKDPVESYFNGAKEFCLKLRDILQ